MDFGGSFNCLFDPRAYSDSLITIFDRKVVKLLLLSAFCQFCSFRLRLLGTDMERHERKILPKLSISGSEASSLLSSN